MSNLRTLLDKGIFPVDQVPEVPRYDFEVAQGGEETYDAVYRDKNGDNVVFCPETMGIRTSDGLIDPNVIYDKLGYFSKIKREAVKGEILRSADLKLRLNVRRNREFRIKVALACDPDSNKDYKLNRELQLKLCRSDILYFCNVFCKTFDPRLSGNARVEFVTFPFQDDVLTWLLWLIKEQQRGLIEKSRDMGATWLLVVVSAWCSLFTKDFVDVFMSLTEQAVDDKTESSILGKYRMLIEGLPPWMRGGWERYNRRNDREMLIQIPETDATIRGELSKGTSGRSGRSSRVCLDEMAFFDNGDDVLRSTNSLSESSVYLSTPRGMGNTFYRIATTEGVNKKTLHWSLHPQKDLKWAMVARSSSDATGWNQEYEISYAGSTSHRVFPEFNFLGSNDPGDWVHVGKGDFVSYDPLRSVFVGGDLGQADPTAWVFAQIKPAPEAFRQWSENCLVIFDCYEKKEVSVADWSRFLQTRGQSQGVEMYRYDTIVADAMTLGQRNCDLKTWQMGFREHGLNVVGKRVFSELETIQSVQELLLRKGALIVNSECNTLIKCFQNWSYRVDPKTGETVNQKTVHGKYSHMMKALIYLCVYLKDTLKSRSTQKAEYTTPRYSPIQRLYRRGHNA